MGTLVCTIELDKEKGVTVKLENADGKTTQTVKMDGTAITIEVKGESDTSTYVQKADSIVMKVKNFTVDCEALTLKSSKDSKWTSQQKLEVASTQDMKLESKAKLLVNSTADTQLESKAKVVVKATAPMELSGATVKVEGKGEVKVEGAKVAITGKAQVEVSAPMAKMAGKGKLDLESSGLATLKGSLTNVGGSLVKLG